VTVRPQAEVGADGTQRPPEVRSADRIGQAGYRAVTLRPPQATILEQAREVASRREDTTPPRPCLGDRPVNFFDQCDRKQVSSHLFWTQARQEPAVVMAAIAPSPRHVI